VSGLIPTYRGAVNAWECDRMGHMNVQFYLGKSTEALGFLRLAMGLTPAAIRSRRLTLLPVADRIHFKRELRAGDIFTMASGVREVTASDCRTYTEIVNSESGKLAASIERRLQPFDLASESYCAWPADIRAGAERLAAAWDGPPAPEPQGPPLPPPDAPGSFETYRSSINSWEVDENGHASLRYHVHRFSNAMSHLWTRVGLTGAVRKAHSLGVAALDYDVQYHRPLKVGDSLIIRSALIELGEKRLRICHHMQEADSGALVTSIGIVLTLFDLVQRKSVPMPPVIRAAALRFCLPAG